MRSVGQLRHCVSGSLRRQLHFFTQEVSEPLILGCLRLAVCFVMFSGKERKGIDAQHGNGMRYKCDPDFRANWEGRRALGSRFLGWDDACQTRRALQGAQLTLCSSRWLCG